ncbi:hypothetical protein B9Z19DRAFT_1078852 [Tuber borchii]|uniref:Uncharacterized protein n=1 Tax=Tuber borchii TaxID=42251 RepID=A0A2T6ZZ23_TUBBO|nr:hypothetical protein B9Z19DRAFT_1078852 [Tuber borchii]
MRYLRPSIRPTTTTTTTTFRINKQKEKQAGMKIRRVVQSASQVRHHVVPLRLRII